jgi:hypothetical protein
VSLGATDSMAIDEKQMKGVCKYVVTAYKQNRIDPNHRSYLQLTLTDQSTCSPILGIKSAPRSSSSHLRVSCPGRG